jgi:hypothetical protein
VEIAGRIQSLVPKVKAETAASLAIEARNKMKLRHAPLLLVREMARLNTHREFVSRTLAQVIQRADELAEFVATYWKDGKAPLSAQAKKGLAKAFRKFDEYQLAKYDRNGPIRLRDVLFLCHAKPRDADSGTTDHNSTFSSVGKTALRTELPSVVVPASVGFESATQMRSRSIAICSFRINAGIKPRIRARPAGLHRARSNPIWAPMCTRQVNQSHCSSEWLATARGIKQSQMNSTPTVPHCPSLTEVARSPAPYTGPCPRIGGGGVRSSTPRFLV